MAQKKRTKKKTYLCVICGKKKKAPKGAQCCDREMVKKEGVWPD